MLNDEGSAVITQSQQLYRHGAFDDNPVFFADALHRGKAAVSAEENRRPFVRIGDVYDLSGGYLAATAP